ncbi:MAG: trypsin-like peptidase domain-containing protein, partial [Bacteroidota bacterium]
MKKTLIICLLCYSSFLFAQHTSPLPAPTATPSSALKQLLLPTQDNDALRAAELQRRGPGIAPHFAKAIDVNIQPNSHGEWETLPDGSLVWRVRIASTGAYSLNLGFSSYQMPPNGTLLLYDSAAKEVVGPFSAMDNETHNQFWSPLVKTDELIVELWLPAEEKNDVSLTLNKINHDFMDWASILSGSCNLDVACGADDGWEIVDGYRDLIQSVGNYTAQGITSCTGFLINNTEGDCRPYFVTAFHCELTANNAPSMVVYWNFESPECRPVGSSASGGNGNGSLALFNSGATYRAGYAPSDMVLVELDDPVNEDADAFYVGWTREETLAQDTIIAIHHPNGEEKRISFAFDGVYRGQWGAGAAAIPDGNHVIVADWAIGTTEGGSSGCPLFNDDKQVIGQLHGGAASCFNDAYDSFGWFTTSWDGGGTASTSLRSWLDPNGSGVPTLRGRSQASCGFALLTEETIINICANSSASLTINTPSSFTAPLDLSFGDVPAGLNIVPSSSTLEGGTSTQIEFLTDAAITPGNYSITVNGLNGLEGTSLLLTIIIEDQLPEPETLSPADGINNSPSAIDFFWSELVPGRAYDLQVSTSSDFSTLVYDLSNQITMPIRLQFQPNDTYHWRVKGTNDCGEGGWSSVATFSTAPITCIDKQAS